MRRGSPGFARSLRGRPSETLTGNVAEAATAEAAVTRAEGTHGGIDHLFCNAGIDPLSATTVVETTEAQWDAVMAVNVKSAFLFARRAIPGMAARGGGNIVFTASIAALKAGAGEAAYNVSKAALLQLARSIAIDHARQGIRCNAICPGYLESVMADRKAEMTPADAAPPDPPPLPRPCRSAARRATPRSRAPSCSFRTPRRRATSPAPPSPWTAASSSRDTAPKAGPLRLTARIGGFRCR